MWDDVGWEGVTTLVTCNIPSRFDRERLMAQWPPKQWDIDFIHMPWNATRRIYAGYAFINFDTPLAATNFCRQWHGQWIAKTKRTKKLRICAAQLQGLEENLRHLKQAQILKFAGKSKWPAVFKDGVQLDIKAIMHNLSLVDLDSVGDDRDYFSELPHGQGVDCSAGGESDGEYSEEEPFVMAISL